MGLMEKLKLLFIVQKPAGEILDAVAEAKKTKKWVHFTVTALGIAIPFAAAMSGYMSPASEVVLTSALMALYNIVRGADKADNNDVKGTFTSTEFWMSAINEAQKAIVNVHTGGVTSPALDNLASFLSLGTLALGQNLAARAPNPQELPAPLDTTKVG